VQSGSVDTRKVIGLGEDLKGIIYRRDFGNEHPAALVRGPEAVVLSILMAQFSSQELGCAP
jgi:hypothetical protein